MNNAKAGSGLRPPSKIARPSSIAGSTSDLTTSRSSSPSVGMVLTENTDQFIVGHRVWVGGTKPGYIQYIGETKFAPGEWAGIVLDEAIGKNDGSVAGVKYFQCEPKKGVFSRLNKLTLEPLTHLINQYAESEASIGRSVSPKPSLPSSRLSLSASRSTTPTSGSITEGNLQVGDNVNVVSASGVKSGILRYLGATDFATGEWAGIELNDSVGKNDGSVNGKRYFTCSMKYGLFAPVAKVSKSRRSSSAAPKNGKSPLPSSALSPRRSAATPRRVGSQESVNTIGSATSSASRSMSSKPRLGVTALTSSGKPSRVGTSIAATHTAMQGALKEKEQHIDQLIRERELEMADVAKSLAQMEELERTLGEVKSEYQRYKDDAESRINSSNNLIETKEEEIKRVSLQLDEERKKIEDLQFRLEEEAIMTSELETGKSEDDQRLKILEEKFEAEKLELESQLNFQNEEALAKLADEVETIQKKLENSQELVLNLEISMATDKSKTDKLEQELLSKTKLLSEMEEQNNRLQNESKLRNNDVNENQAILANYCKDIETLQLKLKSSEMLIQSLHGKNTVNENCLVETTEELTKKSKLLEELNARVIRENEENEKKNIETQHKHQSNVIEIQSKLLGIEHNVIELTKERNELQMQRLELEKKLKLAEDHSLQQINKYEAEIADQLRSSGDNSVQLVKLNDQLREAEKNLRDSRQQCVKLEEELNERVREKSAEIESLHEKQKVAEGHLLQQTKKFEAEIADQIRLSEDNSVQLVKSKDQLRETEKALRDSQQLCEKLKEESNKSLREKDAEIESLNEKHKLAEEHLLLQTKKFEAEISDQLRSSGDNSAQLVKLNDQLRETEKSLRDSQQQCEKLKEESNKHLREKNSEIESLREKHLLAEEHLSQQTKKFEAEIADHLRSSEDHSAQLAKLNGQLLEEENTLRNSQQQCEKLKEELNKILSEKNAEIENLREKHKSAEEHLVQQIKKHEEEIADQLRSSGNNSAQLVKLNDQLREAEKTLRESEQQCQKLKEESDKSLREINADIESLQEKHKLDLENVLKNENEKLCKEKREFGSSIERMKIETEQRLHEMQNLIKELEDQKKKSEEVAKNDDNYLEEIKNELDIAQTMNEKYFNSIAALETSNEHFSAQVERLSTEKIAYVNEVNLQKEKLEENLRIFESANKQLTSQVGELTSERTMTLKELNLKDEKLSVLTREMEKLKGEFAHHHLELQQKLEEAKLDDITVQNLKNHMEMQQRNLEAFQTDLRASQEQVVQLRLENAEIPKLKEQRDQLSLKLQASVNTLKDLELRESQIIKDCDSEKETAQNLAETSRILLEQISSEALKLQTQILELKLELANKDSALELANKRNAQQLQQLEAKMQVTNGSTVEFQLREEKEALESQIDFLNSVIVDMQKKVDSFQSKLLLLESGTTETGSDVNLNEIKIKAAPRLFCDICDMFDVHETEDCPRQASSCDSPPPTNHHGKRNQERPYCDICEVFGHWTNECDDNETF